MSIDNLQGQTIETGDVTILLGANGSGKSNIVAFFKMLNYMMTGALQQYVGKYGVSQILFYGPSVTETTSAELTFAGDEVSDKYEVRLSYGLPDRLYVSGEKVTHHKFGHEHPREFYPEGSTSEINVTSDTQKPCSIVSRLLSRIRTYQFHDTSDTAKIKDRGYIDDTSYLRSDGGNLAAFLRMLRETEDYTKYYNRIVKHIQHVMPQLGDFDLSTLAENNNYVRLNWRDTSSSSYLFGPDQISDGSLRFMALATLLLQPPEKMPSFIVIDEPELGLHPSAISELAGMVKMASAHAQILLATQSMRLIDEFTPEQIVVVERDNNTNSSQFRRLNRDQLTTWLERYSLSELWEKNVLGGLP